MGGMSSQSSAADPQRNPILRATFPIPFAEVGAEHVAPALRYALAEAERAYEAVAAARPPTGTTICWADWIVPARGWTGWCRPCRT